MSGKDAKQISVEAIEHCEPDQWPDYLDHACAGDVQLRDRVAALLEAHFGEESLLDNPAACPADASGRHAIEQAGDRIGR